MCVQRPGVPNRGFGKVPAKSISDHLQKDRSSTKREKKGAEEKDVLELCPGVLGSRTLKKLLKKKDSSGEQRLLNFRREGLRGRDGGTNFATTLWGTCQVKVNVNGLKPLAGGGRENFGEKKTRPTKPKSRKPKKATGPPGGLYCDTGKNGASASSIDRVATGIGVGHRCDR